MRLKNIENNETEPEDLHEQISRLNSDFEDRSEGPYGKTAARSRLAVEDALMRLRRQTRAAVQSAIAYSRANPARATLVTFGAGLGLGVLLATGRASRAMKVLAASKAVK